MGCSASKQDKYMASTSSSIDFTKDISSSFTPVSKNDSTFTSRTDETLTKLPGSIRGDKFSVSDCKSCSLLLLDSIGIVTVDRCTDCTFVIGPTSASVFLRDCTNCSFTVACQQFRTRNLTHSKIRLYCMTQPIIESSHDLEIGCWDVSYEHLISHFIYAHLDPLTNKWNSLYNFTPEESNVTFVTSEAPLIPCPRTDESQPPLSLSLPLLSSSPGTTTSTVLLVCFSGLGTLIRSSHPSHSATIIPLTRPFEELVNNLQIQLRCQLQTTRTVTFIPADVKKGLTQDGCPSACLSLGRDDLVGAFLLFSEQSLDSLLQSISSAIPSQLKGCFYVSPSPESVKRDLRLLK
ncbi:putative XRP2 like protein [Blattamonas nauphoetae]|uniref:XRP2 like protein n=1 Tax=Blattamonas nauphoetae TaxID=2049346 RepID=A0ABQ9Y989_9EUKA|nr:putative XRP2 like protein [Blattamonas nauphoetae]